MEQAASMARLISPKRTKNVMSSKWQSMQWELTLVEHESKFSEVADSVKNSCNESYASQGCAREIPRRTFPLRRTSKSCVCICGREAGWTRCERWTSTHGHWTDRQVRRRGRRCQCSSNSAVRMIDPIRNTSNCPTTSENPSIVGLPTCHHQRHANRPHETRKPWSGETNQSAGEKKRLVCCRCAKGHPARLCPSGDDCQDVDEVGTEPSSDADRDLFGLDWGDDPIATINSVTDRTRGGTRIVGIR